MLCPCSPFLLPCALTACLGILTTLVNIFYMEETLASRRGDYQPLEKVTPYILLILYFHLVITIFFFPKTFPF